jgi:hypothetical protein
MSPTEEPLGRPATGGDVRRSWSLPGRGLGVAALALSVLCAPTAARTEPNPEPPPAVSPARVSQTIGVVAVTVDYGRLRVSRAAAGGEAELDPSDWLFADDQAPLLSFSHDVQVEGEDVAAGTYAVSLLPGRPTWTMVLTPDSADSDTTAAASSRKGLRLGVRARDQPFRETLEITFPEIAKDAAVAQIAWGGSAVSLTISVDLRRTTVEVARSVVAQAGPDDGQTVWQWADYFLRNGYNLDEALTWSETLVEGLPIYWTHALHARLLARLGRTEEAIVAAAQALELASSENGRTPLADDADRLEHELLDWRRAHGDGRDP